jgi:hypothetical protein
LTELRKREKDFEAGSSSSRLSALIVDISEFVNGVKPKNHAKQFISEFQRCVQRLPKIGQYPVVTDDIAINTSHKTFDNKPLIISPFKLNFVHQGTGEEKPFFGTK